MLQWTHFCCECTEELCDMIKSNKKCLQTYTSTFCYLYQLFLARIINVQSKTDSLLIDAILLKSIFFRHTESLMDWVVSADGDKITRIRR